MSGGSSTRCRSSLPERMSCLSMVSHLDYIEVENSRLCTDSIVRGTTSKEIIQMAKDVGAKKVIMASCAPPIRSVSLISTSVAF